MPALLRVGKGFTRVWIPILASHRGPSRRLATTIRLCTRPNFLKRKYFFIDFREGEEEIETSMMRLNHCSAASCMPPTGDQACNLGMGPCPESNSGPFSPQADTLSTEPNRLEQPNLIIRIGLGSSSNFQQAGLLSTLVFCAGSSPSPSALRSLPVHHRVYDISFPCTCPFLPSLTHLFSLSSFPEQAARTESAFISHCQGLLPNL
uniref:Uncharacterized protein n=1 Tax=Myotis myotis TaxID=51298 RepID=A0A7J7S1R5_MYOMY|nr:hypothetical protein mMyoMyo1_010034 [Myotis myotis]